jgi:hypothetical protein
MWDFFRVRRHQTGCVALLMASALTLLWLRSDVIRDEVDLCPSFYWPHLPWYGEIVSLQGSLGWHRYEMEPGLGGIGADFPVTLHSYHVKHYFACSPIIEDTLVWHWKWGGFGYGASNTHLRGMSAHVWIIPFWSVIIPLTVFATFLLLYRPRKLDQKKLTEPAANEGS